MKNERPAQVARLDETWPGPGRSGREVWVW